MLSRDCTQAPPTETLPPSSTKRGPGTSSLSVPSLPLRSRTTTFGTEAEPRVLDECIFIVDLRERETGFPVEDFHCLTSVMVPRPLTLPLPRSRVSESVGPGTVGLLREGRTSVDTSVSDMGRKGTTTLFPSPVLSRLSNPTLVFPSRVRKWAGVEGGLSQWAARTPVPRNHIETYRDFPHLSSYSEEMSPRTVSRLVRLSDYYRTTGPVRTLGVVSSGFRRYSSGFREAPRVLPKVPFHSSTPGVVHR